MRRTFFKHVGQTSPSPLAIEVDRADGVFIYSRDRRYLDLVSGVCVSNVGHHHPEVTEAVRSQVEDYFHLMVYGEMIEAPQVLHAGLLTSILPPSLDCIYYVNSGSEAVDAALKLAKRLTGRSRMVSFENCYHGSSHASLSLMSDEQRKNAFRPLLPEVDHLRFNNIRDLERITGRTACVIVEPVQGEAGVIVPEDGFLQALRRRCDETGAMLIFDEVQTGFGRTGRMFAFEKYGVVPDILVLAKALGGGMPLGGVVSSKSNLDAFTCDPVLGHITTFGGHPVCCAAALASLKVLLREDWVGSAEAKGLYIEEELRRHPAVSGIRRSGLLIAVDLGREDYAARMLELLLDEGAVSDYFLFNPTSFRIAPPLSISMDEVRMAVDLVRKALDRL
ncbi:MAG TPA: aspartate aminotransferase family protein [Candidatus Coprenecus stercoravium]|uniref:Aspartate aminotransferase family protein n=1 Tax=Candidatus Coprenecus stercoravium TaxID=2840735 RepID=A0A9D2GRP5_9BACT|nr:aspartate aminotransferase family protein [Candidatus Coprenecus stercoravium]